MFCFFPCTYALVFMYLLQPLATKICADLLPAVENLKSNEISGITKSLGILHFRNDGMESLLKTIRSKPAFIEFAGILYCLFSRYGKNCLRGKKSILRFKESSRFEVRGFQKRIGVLGWVEYSFRRRHSNFFRGFSDRFYRTSR